MSRAEADVYVSFDHFFATDKKIKIIS
jgi:hypothetical protein